MHDRFTATASANVAFLTVQKLVSFWVLVTTFNQVSMSH
jgi:hypothetical protein